MFKLSIRLSAVHHREQVLYERQMKDRYKEPGNYRRMLGTCLENVS